jgi:ribosomal protein S18 acetylase RimI-like enzyme
MNIANVDLRDAGVEDLASLRGLWLQLHHHHQRVVEDFDGFLTDDELSWTRRRAMYEELLANQRGFVSIAVRDGGPVAYAAVKLHDGDDDTFAIGARYAEVLTLVVDAGARSAGLGTLLLDDVDARLHALGIDDQVIAVMAANQDALRFYRRRGLQPIETYLWRVRSQDAANGMPT